MEDMSSGEVALMSGLNSVNILGLRIKESFRSRFHVGSADNLKVVAHRFDFYSRHAGVEVRLCTSGPGPQQHR